jgi:hypothetical protein
MIRDPSDGSVRAPQKPEIETHNGTTESAVVTKATVTLPCDDDPILDATTSGLPTGSTKPENIARLEKSREWLENYRKNPLQFRSGQPREGN